MSSGGTVSLITPETTIKVSSTLDKSVGKKYLTDGSSETCWTSQQGLPQYVQLTFPTSVIPKAISLTFQGGFVGRQCAVHLKDPEGDAKSWKLLAHIYPEDVNRRQTFALDPTDPTMDTTTSSMKLTFEESSDFFGRITVYDLGLEGVIVS